MSWREAIIANLPPSEGEDEPQNLRRDILDELEDHLHCAMRRELLRDRSFYLLHSPEDFIPMHFPEQARDALSEAGANVQLQTYEGGHGWRGDVYGTIRRGIRWLESHPSGTPD